MTSAGTPQGGQHFTFDARRKDESAKLKEQRSRVAKLVSKSRQNEAMAKKRLAPSLSEEAKT